MAYSYHAYTERQSFDLATSRKIISLKNWEIS